MQHPGFFPFFNSYHLLSVFVTCPAVFTNEKQNSEKPVELVGDRASRFCLQRFPDPQNKAMRARNLYKFSPSRDISSQDLCTVVNNVPT